MLEWLREQSKLDNWQVFFACLAAAFVSDLLGRIKSRRTPPRE